MAPPPNAATSNPYIKVKPPVKLWDGGAAHPIFSSMATVNVGNTQQYIFFGTGSDLLPSNSVNQQYKLVAVLDNGASGSQTFSQLLSHDSPPRCENDLFPGTRKRHRSRRAPAGRPPGHP